MTVYTRATRVLLASSLAVFSMGCGDDGVDSDEEARLAYLGLDQGVDRALELGFEGYNQASNANIPDQSESGDLSGTMTVGGKVDQGASNNKEMDLDVSLDDYSDGVVEEDYEIHYDTNTPLSLGLSLKGLPDADMTGTFTGTVLLDEESFGGERLTLSLSIVGKTEADPDDGTIRRAEGTVRVSGTAESESGVYDVDVTY